MSFSTYEFVFAFLPIVLWLYYAVSKSEINKKHRLQEYVLILASCVFIGMAGLPAIIFIIGSAVVNYFLMCLIRKKERKLVIFVGVLLNVLFLGYFKYYNFLIDNINTIFDVQIKSHSFILPLGISFYTFQQILLLVEYGKSSKEKVGFLEYLSGILFFPRVISGPIMPLTYMQRQWRQIICRIDYRNLSAGCYLFCIGLFKKAVIADTLVYFVDNGYGIAGDINFWQAWCTSICYTMQIYFDFSGYSDMAIGVARTLGIEVPFNFDSPYHSQSITEFWRRWHISLSKALSNIVYIPLGGNRKGKMRTCFNLLVTFLVSGLWHGASWTFVLWGAIHGIFVIIERLTNDWIEKVPKLIRNVITFLIVNCLWVLFRAESVKQALMIYQGMLRVPKDLSEVASLSAIVNDGIIPIPDLLWAVYLLIILILLFMLLSIRKNSNQLYKEFVPDCRTMTFAVSLFSISVIHMSRLANFVYVNF